MTTHFEKISKNNRYGYGRVSSKEQAENSSLESQKSENGYTYTVVGATAKNIEFLKSLKNVSEARAKNRARVYYREVDGKIEILAKSTKRNKYFKKNVQLIEF